MIGFKQFLLESDIKTHSQKEYVEKKHKELANNYPEKNYTVHQRKAINTYVNESSGKITKHFIQHGGGDDAIRKIKDDKQRSTVAHLHHALSASPELHSNLDVYHGTGNSTFTKDLKPGDTLHNHGYVSTTIDSARAGEWSAMGAWDKKKSKAGTGTILHYKLPAKSKHGMYISHMEHNDDDFSSLGGNENEYILNRNQKWKVHKISEHKIGEDNHRVIELHPHKE